MTRAQLEKLVKYLDDVVETLVKWEQNWLPDVPIPQPVYEKLQSAIALIENELTFEEEIEPLDFQKKSWHEGLEELADSIEDD